MVGLHYHANPPTPRCGLTLCNRTVPSCHNDYQFLAFPLQGRSATDLTKFHILAGPHLHPFHSAVGFAHKRLVTAIGDFSYFQRTPHPSQMDSTIKPTSSVNVRKTWCRLRNLSSELNTLKNGKFV